MAWRVAKSLDQLLKQVNALVPGRDKSSDGSIGDERHQAESSSDHNPWVHDGVMGVVTARDFTNDPAHGMNSRKLAEALLASKDPRIKYIISNREIASGSGQSQPAWVWRKYTGINPHDHHCHVSVKADKAHYDDEAPWTFNMDASPTSPVPVLVTTASPPVLRKGAVGPDVEKLQLLIKVKVDGDFGNVTDAAVRSYQKAHGVVADGVVGPQTWKLLEV